VVGWIKGVNMKKILIYVITILAILNLMACEQTSQPVAPTSPQTTTPTPPQTTTPTPPQTTTSEDASDETSNEETVEVLSPPTNLSIIDDVLTWDISDEVEEYVIIIDQISSFTIKGNTVNLLDYQDQLSAGVVNIEVLSQSGDRISVASRVEYIVPIKPPSNVTLSMDSNNTLEIKWAQVPGANSYVVIFDNEFEIARSSSTLSLRPYEVLDNEVILNATDVRIVSVDTAGNRSAPSENAVFNESILAPVIQPVSGRFSEIEWSQVRNATHYSITVDNETIFTSSTEEGLYKFNLSPGLKTFEVKAHVLGVSSSPVATLTEFYGFEISLPELPLRVCTSCNSSSSSKTYEITSITYNYTGFLVEIFFTGRLIESASGPNTAVSGSISFRILDEEDFTIDSSSFGISSLFPGEGFRNQNATWLPTQSDSPYGKYRLDIITVQN
jgi:hypothetical protein